MGDLSTRNTPQDWEASWWRTSWLTWWWRWNSFLLQSSWKNIYQSQRHIDLWISLHDSDSGWVGPDKGPFNRRRTPLCRSGAAVVNARANGVLQILSQPMSMEVVTEQRSKRCCTLHADVLNFCTIIYDVRCKFLHLGRLCSQYGGQMTWSTFCWVYCFTVREFLEQRWSGSALLLWPS